MGKDIVGDDARHRMYVVWLARRSYGTLFSRCYGQSTSCYPSTCVSTEFRQRIHTTARSSLGGDEPEP